MVVSICNLLLNLVEAVEVGEGEEGTLLNFYVGDPHYLNFNYQMLQIVITMNSRQI